jgi:hypothetical protein
MLRVIIRRRCADGFRVALRMKPLRHPTNQKPWRGNMTAKTMAGTKDPPVTCILFSSSKSDTRRTMWRRILVMKKETANRMSLRRCG